MSIRAGFELEFISSKSLASTKLDLAAFGLQLGTSRGNYSKWYLTTDGSIRSGSTGYYDYSHNLYGTWTETAYGLELISPIFELEKCLENIKKIFQWVSGSDYKINGSCGFHVGMSFSNKAQMKKLDLNKLILLFDEEEVLTKFKRSKNSYCSNHINEFKRTYKIGKVILADGTTSDAVVPKSRYYDDGINDPKLIEKGVYFSSDKYHSINIGKYIKGYIEFRAMGGANYHKKFDQVQATIRHYAEIMEAASDPNEKQVLYKKRFKELIKSIA